jgi:hypothetical protein
MYALKAIYVREPSLNAVVYSRAIVRYAIRAGDRGQWLARFATF